LRYDKESGYLMLCTGETAQVVCKIQNGRIYFLWKRNKSNVQVKLSEIIAAVEESLDNN